MAQTISFDELVARREQREAARTVVHEIAVPGSDKVLLAKRPSDARILTLYGILQSAGEDMSEYFRMIDGLIYHSCPALQDKKLHEALGIADPMDVVPAVFTPEERDGIGGALMRAFDLLSEDAPTKN